MLSPTDAAAVGNAILSEVQDLGIPKIHKAVAAAGMDAGQLAPERDRSQLMPGVYKLFSDLPYEAKLKAIPILAEQVLRDAKDRSKPSGLIRLLEQHGFQYVNGAVLPTGFFDEREAQHLPRSSVSELTCAMDRLSRNDLSGAITSATGAVDSAAGELIAKYNLGTAASFQAKVNTVLNRLKIFEEMSSELEKLGVSRTDAENISTDLKETVKTATSALGVIRREMGDVHGRKPSDIRMVYGSIKLALAICGFLEGR